LIHGKVRDDNKTRAKAFCHEPGPELDSGSSISASGLLFSAFGRSIFHPRPQDGVFRCGFNKTKRIEECEDSDGIMSGGLH